MEVKVRSLNALSDVGANVRHPIPNASLVPVWFRVRVCVCTDLTFVHQYGGGGNHQTVGDGGMCMGRSQGEEKGGGGRSGGMC